MKLLTVLSVLSLLLIGCSEEKTEETTDNQEAPYASEPQMIDNRSKQQQKILEKSMHTSSGVSHVQIKYIDRRPEKPPKIRMFFDVTLINDYSEPRWFLFPDRLKTISNPKKYSIYLAEVYRLSGEGSLAVGHFSGSSGFYAVLLPSSGQAKLHRFPILYWGKFPISIPTSVQIEVIMASQLTVGDKPAGDWFGMNPMSDAKADVWADALKDQSRVIITNHSPDLKEVSVTMEDKTLLDLQVNITLENE